MVSVFLKLFDLVERNWRDSRQPKQRLAKATTALYSALVTCHQAYETFRSSGDEQSLRRWAESVDTLVVTLSGLKDTLTIFSPDVYAHIEQYLRSERRISGGFYPQDKAEFAIGELMFVVGDRQDPNYRASLHAEVLAEGEDTEFVALINRFGDFIRLNFKIEDIFGALDT